MYEENSNDIDKENLFQVIENMPNQLMEGLELSKEIAPKGEFDTLLINGMGGSALVGDLLQIYLDVTVNKERRGNPFRIIINRSYALPMEAFNPKCLNVISSYSGNTEETLSAFKEVYENKLACIAISSGGKVTEIARECNVPLVKLPQGMQPRMGIGTSFSALLGVLINIGVVKNVADSLASAKLEIYMNMEKYKEIGKKIAGNVHGETPVVYSSWQFKSIAMIWKIMFNENSKTPAFWNYFPELNHNEMVGFTNPQANFSLIFLEDNKDDPRNLKRFERMASLLANYGTKVTKIEMPEGEIIFRIFSILQIGCFASYYLAIAYETDPTPVAMVERFKELLK